LISLALIENSDKIINESFDADGLNALMIGIHYCNYRRYNEISLRIIRMIIDKIGDIDYRDNHNRTALHYAVMHNDSDVEIISLLANKNANMNLFDFDGNSALHYAAYYDMLQHVNALIANNADICLENNDHVTALDMAHSETYKLLKSETVRRRQRRPN
jgi:ankyrin repeat protein